MPNFDSFIGTASNDSPIYSGRNCNTGNFRLVSIFNFANTCIFIQMPVFNTLIIPYSTKMIDVLRKKLNRIRLGVNFFK